MTHSSAVGFFAFAFCLFACVSASVALANEENLTVISKQTAEQAVEAAKKSIKDVSDKAQSNIDNATLLLQKVKLLKTQVEEVAVQAEQLANGNEEAAATVNKITKSSQTVSTLHLSATEELNGAVASLSESLKQAQTLNSEFDKGELLIDDSTENYTPANTKALDIKRQAEKLDTNITGIMVIMDKVQTSVQNMEQGLKEAKVDNLHVGAIVAVTELETKIQEADGIIQETQNTTKEIDDVVKEMQELKTTDNIDLSVSFETLINSANGELTKATDVVKKAEKAKSDMTAQKQKADAALSTFATATEINTAKQAEDATKECVQQVQLIIQSLKSPLETTKTSLTSAKGLKAEMVQALFNAKKKTSTKQGKETMEVNHPVGLGTEPDQKDTTIEPTSKELPSQINNSADKLKDTLTNSAQNVPTTALTGEKAPVPGAKNDSAMTVSVPLLVALIASAVLQ